MQSTRQAAEPGEPAAASGSSWHALPHAEVVALLGSSAQGLASPDAVSRLARHGPNELPATRARHPLLRLLAQFNNALIYFLLTAALLAALLAHYVDAVVIALVVSVNAIVGFVQEGRAEQSLNALRAMLAPHARVLRDGERRTHAVRELVPGDIVLLEAGDRVPADLRLLHARGVLIDEAILTGESVTAGKREEPAAADAALGDRHSMAWSGTLVAAGQATGVVVATGRHTEIGRISALLSTTERLTTPLLRQINQFGQRFTMVALGAAALLLAFAIGVRDYAWLDALMIVVALAVGVVPEGLPAVITITLAIGVRRMAARNAIVRHLPAVETLGATSVICSDKTGTLTRNEMAVRRVVTSAGEQLAQGEGYSPEGGLSGAPAQPGSALQRLLHAAALCNDARLRRHDGQWRVDGDPMEGALLALAARAALDSAALAQRHPRLDAIPFDAQHRFMATLHDAPGARPFVLVKGAPERVLSMCTSQTGVDGAPAPLDEAYWQAAIDGAALHGERVLGYAWRHLDGAPDRLDFADVAGLEFAGITGFIDPPRAEAIAAVADCHSAGIAVKMITGDHAATAAAIAQQLGIAPHPEVLTGAQLDALDDDELPAASERTHVFARTSPEHKLRVVRALQSDGAIVAMTGDGVNDAPSLKQADVGIAMGHKGTEAAKEASQVVLTDDNFASIVAAVHEGRTVYDNIRKVIAWTLPTNGGEALAIIAALLMGMTLPMTAPQILWINMILTITLGLVLAFEPPEAGVMRRPARDAGAALLSAFMVWRVCFVSVLFVVAVMGIYTWAIGRGHDVASARTMVVNTLCVLEIFYLFSVRYLHAGSFSRRGIRGTSAVLWAVAGVVLAQLAFTYTPWMQAIFDTRPTPLFEGLVIIATGVALFVLLELEKAFLRRRGWFAELQLATPASRS